MNALASPAMISGKASTMASRVEASQARSDAPKLESTWLGHPVAIAGAADSDPHPPKIDADMGADAPQPVVTGDPAAAFCAHLAGGEIDFVMQDDNGFRRKAMEAHGGADGAARFVHVGLRFEREHRLVAHAALGDLAVEARTPLERTEAMRRSQRVERHEPDVVPMPGRIGAGVAEADQQAGRGARRAFAGAAEKGRVRSPRRRPTERLRRPPPVPPRQLPIRRPLRLPPRPPVRR